MVSIADWSNIISSPSTASSACCCFVSALSGSVSMRMKSCFVSELSSTRMGNLPCSSGMRSFTDATWNAPAAMNRMWSVFTAPCLVVTVDPSTMGSRSLWTPWREISGPPDFPDAEGDAILSISSRNTMPYCSVLSIAFVFIFSLSMSFSVSCSMSIFFACLTVTFLCFVFSGIMFSSMLDMSGSIWSMPMLANMTDACGLFFCVISTWRWSSFPESSCSCILFLVDSLR